MSVRATLPSLEAVTMRAPCSCMLKMPPGCATNTRRMSLSCQILTHRWGMRLTSMQRECNLPACGVSSAMQLGPPVCVAFCKSHRHSEASLLALSRSGRPSSGLLLCCSGPTSWTSAIQPVCSLADRRGSVHLAEVSPCVRTSTQLLVKHASVVRVWGVELRVKQIHWQHG